jgi:GMP synthase (glutamine-hydrolysing)
LVFPSRLEKLQPVLLTHGDSVQKVGDRFRVGAQSSNHLIAAIYNEQMRLYGVQFHPEASHVTAQCHFDSCHEFF